MSKKPEIPEQVFGVSTSSILDLEKSIGYLSIAANRSLLSYKVTERIEPGLRLFPLIERVQQGEELTPEELKPYIPAIKKLVGGKLLAANRVASALYVTGLGIPLKHAIDRRIEDRFASHIPAALEQAGAYLPEVEPYVDFLAEFDNPRAEFVHEIDIIANAIRETSRKQATERGHHEVTSSDAGYAIRRELGRLIIDGKSHDDLPILSELVLKKLGKDNELPEEKVFGVIAPEIMAILDDPLPKDQKDRDFITSLIRNPHPLRGAAQFFKSTRLRFLSQSSPLLSAVRDLLPTQGNEVATAFQKIKDFINISKAP
ncbi:hypothetical protein BVY00_01240 [bacterium G20]|nr:hypothetical protein BVY00_01240 [bacterium G20]